MLEKNILRKRFLAPQNKAASGNDSLKPSSLLTGVLIVLLSTTSLSYAADTEELAKPDTAPTTVQEKITERVRASSDNNFLSFSFENDVIGGGTDENYTSGVRITYFDIESPMPPVIEDMAEAIPTFEVNETTSTFYSVGQNLFTPANITVRADQPNDRPWAAWIYGSIGLATVTENHLDELEFTAGVVGPQALGEQTQKLIHEHITDSDIPKGWNNQLEFEPGLIFSWRRRWPVGYAKTLGDYRFRIEPDINISLGNVYTYAGTGATFTFGPYTDRLQDTPPRVRPAMPGTGFFDTPDDKISWQLFAGLNGRAMGRNIFLDGNTFSDGPSVDKEILVGDANAGIALGFDDYRLSYTMNYRTKEFEGQKADSVFGSITLTTRF